MGNGEVLHSKGLPAQGQGVTGREASAIGGRQSPPIGSASPRDSRTARRARRRILRGAPPEQRAGAARLCAAPLRRTESSPRPKGAGSRATPTALGEVFSSRRGEARWIDIGADVIRMRTSWGTQTQPLTYRRYSPVSCNVLGPSLGLICLHELHFKWQLSLVRLYHELPKFCLFLCLLLKHRQRGYFHR